MRTRLALVAAILMFALPSVHAQQEKSRVDKIPLKFIMPTKMMELLMGPNPAKLGEGAPRNQSLIPRGIKEVIAHDEEMTLSARGTEEAIRHLKEILRIMDIKQREVTLKLRIERITVDANQTIETAVISQPTVRTVNNETAKIAVTGSTFPFQIEVRPRINGDNSVSVVAEFAAEEGRNRQTGKIHRRMKADRDGLLLATSSTGKNSSIALALEDGQQPPPVGPYVAYRVYVTPRPESLKPPQ